MIVTTSSHNWNSDMYSDKEYIEEFGLDPSLEGKPEINEAILQAVAERNREAGVSEEKIQQNIVNARRDAANRNK